MTNNPLFSVLIANYNNAKFIGNTITSIEKQTYSNWEIIIVDDCSTDTSIAIIERFQKKNARIKLFKNSKNEGCGYTKNMCVSFAMGEICGFVDPDDTITSNALEVMVKTHLKYQDASIVFSNYFHCNEKLQIITIRKPPKIAEGNVTISQLNQQLINHFTTFKIQKYKLTSGIAKDLPKAVDQDLYLKLEETGNVIYINRTLYHYRYHKGGISAYNNNYKALFYFMKLKEQTCIRRGIPLADFFEKEYQTLYENYKNTYEYKVGSMLLKPIKSLRRFIFRLTHLIFL